MFIPFSFQGTKVSSSFTPADFTGVQYWWTADAGITESGGAVSVWRDQINNFDMVQATGANQPALTTSATLNGENVISFNGTTDYLYTTSAPASWTTDLTILSVVNLIDTKTGGTFMGAVVIASGTRLWLDTVGGNIRSYNQSLPIVGGAASNFESPATTGAKALKIRYDGTAGDGFYAIDTLTETSYGTGGDTGTTTMSINSTIAIGATLNNNGGTVFGSRYVEVEAAEQVWINGTPSLTEMNSWKTYVNNKYGTIIV